MYKTFFGFSERPFQLVPNPAYLFLSKSHEEALAHLTYAISQGDGFVEITGEVGTGKTTLCRVFLESLSEKSEAAYIFNPRLDAIQLLKAINDDFRISSSKNTVKELIDELNRFLLKKKSENKTVLLIIDEAQNLEPDVLEQLRLLSNLETSTSKLIQIILIGQPELREKLESYELRQLGQRITLSCRLQPLTYEETRDYIRHRIQIASVTPGVSFSRAAMKVIYAFSKGTPRLINIICDRSLITAFAMDKHAISGNIATVASQELKEGRQKRSYRRVLIPLVLTGCIFAAAITYSALWEKNSDERQPDQKQVTTIPVSPQPPVKHHDTPIESEAPAERLKKAVPVPVEKNISLIDLLDDAYVRNSRQYALETLLRLWDVNEDINDDAALIENDTTYIRLGAKQHGLVNYKADVDIDFLLKLNMPAILEFEIPGYTNSLYLVFSGYRDGQIKLSASKGNVISMRADELGIYWTGMSHTLWKNFSGYVGTIPQNAPDESVIILKMLLRSIGYSELEVNSVFDEETEMIIREIQEKNGIDVDGSVGSLTKMIIYNQSHKSAIPHIRMDSEGV